MPAIGIDLGTTCAYVAVCQQRKVRVIENDQGRNIPCCVAFTNTGRLIGRAALHQISRNPKNTIYDIKRSIGRDLETLNLLRGRSGWLFKTEGNESDGKPRVEVTYKKKTCKFLPEEIASTLISKLKQIAETHLEESVTKAVITVPASFNSAQRQATIDAAKIAGIDVLGLVSEPVAVALDCMNRKEISSTKNVLIFQMGGGTFHVTIVTMDEKSIEVKSTWAADHFGGVNFTDTLFKFAALEFKTKYGGTDLKKNAKAACRLRIACEKAKKDLSLSESASIKVDAILNDIDFHFVVTRGQFDKIMNKHIQHMMKYVTRAIEFSKIPEEEIHEVYFVGGATRMPAIQRIFVETFSKLEVKILKTLNVDEAAVRGAAVLAESAEKSKLYAENLLSGKFIINEDASLGGNSTVDIRFDFDSNGILRVSPGGNLKYDVSYDIGQVELKNLIQRARDIEGEEEEQKNAARELHLFEHYIYDEQKRMKDSGQISVELQNEIETTLNWIMQASNATTNEIQERRKVFDEKCQRGIFDSSLSTMVRYRL